MAHIERSSDDPHHGHVAHSISESCIPQCPLYDPYTAGLALCDPDGIVRKGAMHHGTDYPCTGHAHFMGAHIECTSPAHMDDEQLAARRAEIPVHCAACGGEFPGTTQLHNGICDACQKLTHGPNYRLIAELNRKAEQLAVAQATTEYVLACIEGDRFKDGIGQTAEDYVRYSLSTAAYAYHVRAAVEDARNV